MSVENNISVSIYLAVAHLIHLRTFDCSFDVYFHVHVYQFYSNHIYVAMLGDTDKLKLN